MKKREKKDYSVLLLSIIIFIIALGGIWLFLKLGLQKTGSELQEIETESKGLGKEIASLEIESCCTLCLIT